MATKSDEMITDCDHVFLIDCLSCGQDGVYNWITCSEYRSSQCSFCCIKCGSIVVDKYER